MPNPLSEVKRLAKAQVVRFEGQSLDCANRDFGWGVNDILKCIGKLNGRLHNLDTERNHYYKTTPVYGRPDGMHLEMDYYKAKNVMQGFSVYTHFCIEDGTLVISSFKRL
jgi:hypothetical protein